MKRLLFLVIATCLPGCVTVRQELNTADLAILKQRSFEVSKKDAFAGVMAVFQDLGYEIVHTDITTGFIRGKYSWTTGDGVWMPIVKHSKSITAFVCECGEQHVRVRLNLFVDQVNVLSEDAYDDVFNKISSEMLLLESSL